MQSRIGSVLVFAIVALAACKSQKDTGYIEIKTVPVAGALPPIYLDSSKLPQIKKDTTVLTHPVGSVKLQLEGSDGRHVPLCDITVKKDRITTVTLSVLERPPRCQCRISGATDNRVCVS